ncbi:unnamed protein product [Merluccius merluccius]
MQRGRGHVVAAAPQQFHLWRDYMGLALTVERMRDAHEAEHERHENQDGSGKGGGEGGGEGCGEGCGNGGGRVAFCRFCFSNREAACVYRSHELRSGSGRITCPILRAYTCPVCGASGDNAHTLRYCPKKRGGV